jgi:translocator protein
MRHITHRREPVPAGSIAFSIFEKPAGHIGTRRRCRWYAPHLCTSAGAWQLANKGIRDKRASLVIIALLDGVLAAEIFTLRRADPVAASLLAPYLGWSAFATALNAAVSDPGELG